MDKKIAMRVAVTVSQWPMTHAIQSPILVYKTPLKQKKNA